MTAEEAKFYPSPDLEATPIEPGELPSSYGKSHLVLLPVDPYRIYAYWELAGDPPPTTGARAVLRFHESATTSDTTRPFDVDIDLAAGNWNVHLWSADKTYRAELGLRGEDGAFVLLAQSNTVTTPPAHSAAPSLPPAPPPAPPVVPQPTVESPPPPAPRPAPEAPKVTQRIPVPRVVEVPAPEQKRLAAIFDRNPEFILAAPRAPEPEPVLQDDTDPEFELEEPLFEPPLFEAAGPVPSLDAPVLPALPIQLDLTQYCEERFTPGISSEVGALGE